MRDREEGEKRTVDGHDHSCGFFHWAPVSDAVRKLTVEGGGGRYNE